MKHPYSLLASALWKNGSWVLAAGFLKILALDLSCFALSGAVIGAANGHRALTVKETTGKNMSRTERLRHS